MFLHYKQPSLSPVLQGVNDNLNVLSSRTLVTSLETACKRARKVALLEKEILHKKSTNRIGSEWPSKLSLDQLFDDIPIYHDITASDMLLEFFLDSQQFKGLDMPRLQLYLGDHSASTCLSVEEADTPLQFYVSSTEENVKISFWAYDVFFPIGKGEIELNLTKLHKQEISVELITIDQYSRHLVTIKGWVHCKTIDSINNELLYDKNLPVLDPHIIIPPVARPSAAWTLQDKLMKESMFSIALYWRERGPVNALSVVPQRLSARVHWSDTDDWFVDRRLNGFNPGFLQRNSNPEEPFDYYIEWDFSYLNPKVDIKKGALFPEKISARFVLKQDKLVSHSIYYELKGKSHTVINDNSNTWKEAKKLFLYAEVNINFTWTHVGVHFDCEQYAMAVYRNLTEENPIYELLSPHFKDIIINDREVVRPKTIAEGGVVTMAGALTYEGQVRMLQERFKTFTYKWKPTEVTSLSKFSQRYQNCAITFWKLLEEYVGQFFSEHQERIAFYFENQIKDMSDDLERHSLNKTPGSMSISTIDELRHMCVYIIWQAVFYHDWVHWAGWDDFYPSLFFDRESPDCPPNADKLEDIANVIQCFVTFASPTLKQWPILDPELGSPKPLKDLLLKYANILNQPGMMIGSYVTAPNT